MKNSFFMRCVLSRSCEDISWFIFQYLLVFSCFERLQYWLHSAVNWDSFTKQSRGVVSLAELFRLVVVQVRHLILFGVMRTECLHVTKVFGTSY